MCAGTVERYMMYAKTRRRGLAKARAMEPYFISRLLLTPSRKYTGVVSLCGLVPTFLTRSSCFQKRNHKRTELQYTLAALVLRCLDSPNGQAHMTHTCKNRKQQCGVHVCAAHLSYVYSLRAEVHLRSSARPPTNTLA